MKNRRALWMILCVAVAPAALHAETWAEKLGYPADARVLLIHLDDIGMAWEANEGARKYFDPPEGGRIVVSGSLMTTCPWFNEFVAWTRDPASRAHELDLGLHMTLNSEWRNYKWTAASRSRKVRSLLDSSGYLHKGQVATLFASRRGVKKELLAQAERARKAKLAFTHIDTHMGSVFLRKGFLKAYLEVSEELGVPAMVMADIQGTIRCLLDDPAPTLLAAAGEEGQEGGGELELALRQLARQVEEQEGLAIEEVGEKYGLTGGGRESSDLPLWVRVVARWIERTYGPLIEAHPFPKLDRFCGIPYGDTYERTRNDLLERITGLPPGITHFYLHPSVRTEALMKITGSWEKRTWDLELFADPGVVAYLQAPASRIVLTTWREMMERYQSRRGN